MTNNFVGLGDKARHDDVYGDDEAVLSMGPTVVDSKLRARYSSADPQSSACRLLQTRKIILGVPYSK